MFRKLILSAVMATGTVTGLALTPTPAEPTRQLDIASTSSRCLSTGGIGGRTGVCSTTDSRPSGWPTGCGTRGSGWIFGNFDWCGVHTRRGFVAAFASQSVTQQETKKPAASPLAVAHSARKPRPVYHYYRPPGGEKSTQSRQFFRAIRARPARFRDTEQCWFRLYE